MRLGAVVGMRDDPGSFARHVQRLEEAGVSYLWAGEAYTADAVSTLGFLAAVTSRAQLGSAILPLYTRSPSLLAMTAVGLDKLSGGRFILGLGASGPQVVEGFHGIPYDAPLARTAEIIEICRAVWRRERLEYQGAHYQIPLADGRGTGLGKPLKLIDHPVRERIPVYVASLGPKNVEMTAAIAEGWLPLHFWPDHAADVWGAALAAGRPGDRRGCRRSRSWQAVRWRSARTSSIFGTWPARAWRCTSAAWALAVRISTTTSSGDTGSSTRPIRSRTPTSAVTSRLRPRWSPPNWWPACRSSGLRDSSATGSPRTARPESPS